MWQYREQWMMSLDITNHGVGDQHAYILILIKNKYPLNWRLPNKSEIIIEFLIIQEQNNNNNKYNTNGPQFDISSWTGNDTHSFVWDTTPLMLWHNYWALSTTSCTLVGIALQREWVLRHNVRLRVIEVTQIWTFSPWNNIALSYVMEHFTIT